MNAIETSTTDDELVTSFVDQLMAICKQINPKRIQSDENAVIDAIVASDSFHVSLMDCLTEVISKKAHQPIMTFMKEMYVRLTLMRSITASIILFLLIPAKTPKPTSCASLWTEPSTTSNIGASTSWRNVNISRRKSKNWTNKPNFTKNSFVAIAPNTLVDYMETRWQFCTNSIESSYFAEWEFVVASEASIMDLVPHWAK